MFIDLDATDRPVLFVTPGKGKECVKAFRAFLLEHGGEPTRIAEVVCDMIITVFKYVIDFLLYL